MSKPGADAAQITPTPSGWRLHPGGGPALTAPSLPELVPHIPAGAQVSLSLPTYTALLERLTLPASDRDELTGMIQLHLEKTLPYPVEEVTSGYEIIRQTESETTLLSFAIHGPVSQQLCQPLRDAERLPSHLSLFALDLAPHVPAGQRVAAVWAEHEHLAIAIYEAGKLSWAYSLIGADAATLKGDLPSLLLTADVEGVPTNVESVALASDCEEFRELLHDIFGVPVVLFAIESVLPRRDIELVPADWVRAAHVLERRERLQQRLMLGALVYLLLVAVAFVYLAWMKQRLRGIEVEIARTQPLIAATKQQQARLRAMAPAVDRSYFAVEQLYLVNRNRPPAVIITQFISAPDQFTVKGEAPDPGQAIDFAEKLRAEKEFPGYQIDSAPPKIVSAQKAQFSIFGKR
jgi:hypothetical protein